MPFDPNQLASLLGGAQPQGGAFLRGFQRGMQEIAAKKQQEQQGALQQEELGFRRAANERAQSAEQRAQSAEGRAQQDQLLQVVSQLRGGLEGVPDEATLESLTNFYTNLAPRLGIEPGFIQSEAARVRKILPQRQAKAMYDSITKGLNDEQIQQLRESPVTYRQTGSGPGSEITFAQLEEQATSIPPGTLKRPVPKQSQVTAGSFEEYVDAPPERKAQIEAARGKYAESARAGEEEAAAIPISGRGLDMAAKMYALTGQLPPMGMGQQGAAVRARIINRAAEYDQKTDTFTGAAPSPNLAGNQANYRANQAALTQITRNLNAVEAFEVTAEKNAAMLEGILGKLPDAGATFLNRPYRSLAGALGSETVAQFDALRLSLQNEYARLISNPNLVGVLSDSARQEMEQILRPNATIGQLRAVLGTLRQEASNRREAFRAQRDLIQQELGGAASPAGGAVQDPLGIR